MMEKSDINKDGKIDYTEFFIQNSERLLGYSVPKDADKSMLGYFIRMDTDGDGFLTAGDMKQFYADFLGSTLSDDEATAMIESVDGDGDGKISWIEYYKNM